MIYDSLCPLDLPFHRYITQVYRQAFWMRLFGGPTAKRTRCWSNSRGVYRLRTLRLTARMRDAVKEKLAVKTVSKKDGKRGYQGSKALMGSQFLGLCVIRCFNVWVQVYRQAFWMGIQSIDILPSAQV